MKRQTIWKRFAGVAGALSLLVLAACGEANETTAPETGDNGQATAEAPAAQDSGLQINVPASSVDAEGIFSIDHTTFRNAVTNNSEIIDGGILNVGLVQNNPPAGILNSFWGTTVPDAFIRQFFDETMYQVDAGLTMSQEGVATWVQSEDGHTFTFTINENAYWSDGAPLTARDWQFGFEVLASPDYTGSRFDASVRNVVGIEDFHNGDADEIAGVRVIDERVLEIEFINATPSLLAGGIWGNALPYHLFGDIPVAEMEDSPLVRETPIGFGPFVLDHVVPGESWSFVRNEHYWRGRPNLDGINVQVIHNDVVGQALTNGDVDIINSFAASQVPYFFDLDNVEWIGTPNGGYSYISFNLGDLVDGEIVVNEDLITASPYLRRAMWHAVDWDEVGRRLFSGLSWSADGIIPPALPSFFNEDLQRPEPSIEAARAALAEGGFVDVDGDGFVEDPNGEPFVLEFFAGEPQSDAAEAHLLFMVQSWAEAGINVNLNTPEFITMVDMLNADEPGIDLFAMGWGLGWDVDPSVRYGRFSAINRARYTSDELEAILASINTPEAAELSVRRAAMDEWQQYMLDNVVVIPTLHSMTALPVNNRVQNFDLGSLGAMFGSGGGFWHEVGVSSESGHVNGQ